MYVNCMDLYLEVTHNINMDIYIYNQPFVRISTEYGVYIEFRHIRGVRKTSRPLLIHFHTQWLRKLYCLFIYK